MLSLTDFLASGVPKAELPRELRRLVCSPWREGETERTERESLSDHIDRTLVDLPRAGEDEAELSEAEAIERWDDLVRAATICCSALLAYLQAAMHEHALRWFGPTAG